MTISNLVVEAYVGLRCGFVFFPFFTSKRFYRVFMEHMIESFGFVFDVIARHFYTILTSIEFQWIFNLSISKLAIRTETRKNVLIDNLVYDFSELGLEASIGLRIDSKSAYMTNGTSIWE